MKQIYTLSVTEKFATALKIESAKKQFIVKDATLLELSNIQTTTLNQKNIFINIEQEYTVDEIVAVPTAIKNKTSIQNYILQHLKKSALEKKFLFNYQPLEKQTQEEMVLYQVNGVDEEKYEKALSKVVSPQNIKVATLPKFALLSISNQCISAETYISIYTYANSVMVIAVNKKNIIFSRINELSSPTPESLQMDMTSEINQTIAYIQQQNRDLNFKLIALSGSLALSDTVTEQLAFMNSIPIAILYPNYLVSNLHNEEIQEYILPLGNLFVPKELQFFPTKLLGNREFKAITNIMLLLSLLLLFATGYYTFNAYTKYNNLMNRYHAIKHKLIKTVQQTKTLPQNELQKTLTHLEIAKKYLKFHPKDMITTLSPLINLLQPEKLQWSYLDKNIKVDIKFTKQFDTLTSLHLFEKKFANIFQDLNNTTLMLEENSDYKKIYFDATIKTKPMKIPNPRRPRVE